ncbi:hypothetical protein BJ085DRAFT_36851, partial [Dimargaris cristalligena]
FVHAEVTAITVQPGPLLTRTLETLCTNLTQELLEAFRQIDQFSEGGLLQAILEIDLCEFALGAFLTTEARQNIHLLKTYLQDTYQRNAPLLPTTNAASSNGRDARGSYATAESLAVDPIHWQTIRQLLAQVQQRTSMQFRCLMADGVVM